MMAVTDSAAKVVAGVDTHADTIHVAVVDSVGRDIGDREFLTTALGYRQALDFLASFGDVETVGIEGTSSYGAGFARAVLAAGIEVREVIRPERSVRRMHGKSDPIDARQAARAVLTALKSLARRHQFLTTQADELVDQIKIIVEDANPHLLSLYGVGPNTAAQLLITTGANPERLRSEASFAALCGTAPVPASSGKTTRHRLSHGGDRAANCALHTIALVRMSSHAQTRAFVRTQRAKGRNGPEILRILKRAIAREIFNPSPTAWPLPDSTTCDPPAKPRTSP